jgi:hypothetical protein
MMWTARLEPIVKQILLLKHVKRLVTNHIPEIVIVFNNGAKLNKIR